MKFKHHCGITDCGMCGKDCLKQSDSLIMKRKIEVLFVLSMYYEFGKHYLIQTCMKRFIWGKTNEKCQHLVNTFGSLIYPCQRKTSLFFTPDTLLFNWQRNARRLQVWSFEIRTLNKEQSKKDILSTFCQIVTRHLYRFYFYEDQLLSKGIVSYRL